MFFLQAVRLPLAKEAKDSINRLIDYCHNFLTGDVTCDGTQADMWSCCSSSALCGEGEGDCDGDSHCFGNLKCGVDNCIGFGSSASAADCCYLPKPAPASPFSCVNDVPAPSGNITSPGWPNDYPLNNDQCWNITCDQTQIVEISFQSFDLEFHSACK